MLLLFLIFVSIFLSVSAECPKNSIEWQSSCYFYETKEFAFVKAEMFCNNFGGHLASVHDGFTNDFLAQNAKKLSNSPDFWIGVTTLIEQGNWSWTDGSKYDFTEWRKVITLNDTQGENCGAIAISSGLWNADDCFILKPFVCKVNETSLIPPSSSSTTKSVPSSTAAVPSSTIPSKPCALDWAYYAPTKSCYRQIGRGFNFTNAEQYCVNVDAHLTSIHDQAEFDFTQSLAPNTYYRIGLYSDDNKITWKWTDKSAYDFAPWIIDEGNPGCDQCSSCALAGFDIFENNNTCEDDFINGICKKPADT